MISDGHCVKRNRNRNRLFSISISFLNCSGSEKRKGTRTVRTGTTRATSSSFCHCGPNSPPSIMPSLPFPFIFFLLALLSILSQNAVAQVAIPRFTDCFSGSASNKLNISTVYAQITTSEPLGTHLNITLLGQSPETIQGSANGSSDLGTCPSTSLRPVKAKVANL